MNPRWIKTLTTLAKPVIIPLVMGIVGLYFHYRLERAKELAKLAGVKTEVSYETLAPRVAELQEQVKTLSVQVDLLKDLLSGQGEKPSSRPLSIVGGPLLERIRTSPPNAPRAMRQRPLPDRVPNVPE